MAVFQWQIINGTGTYSFDSAANWTLESGTSATGFPGVGDTASILGPASGTAETITGPATTGTLNVDGLNIFSGDFATSLTQLGDTAAASLELAAGATLTTSTQLIVGSVDDATLTIDSGATVSASRDSSVGALVIGSSNTSNSLVTVAAGGTLDLTGALQDNNYSAIVGVFGTGTLDVSGTMDTGGNPLAIGYAGNGAGFMTVSNGGSVTVGTESNGFNASVALAVGHDQADGTLTITDAGSEVTADGNMYVGRGGTGTLIVENSGNLTAGATEDGIVGLLAIGTGGQTDEAGDFGGTGSALVTSSGTITDLGGLTVGGNGVTGSMTVSDGGVVNVTDQILLGVGNTIDGTYHTGSGTLAIGMGGTVALVGGPIYGAPGLAVGNAVGSFGTLSVSGYGAVLDLGSSNLVVGNSGTGTMNVSGYATVTAAASGPNSAAIVLGANAGATGSLITSESTIVAKGALIVGEEGFGTASLGNTNVSVTDALIGDAAGSVGSLDLMGGTLTGTGTLSVGSAIGGIGNLVIGGDASFLTGTLYAGGPATGSSSVALQGGTLATTNGFVLDSGTSLFGSGTIDGAVTNAGTISVQGEMVFNGNLGGSGVVLIENNAVLAAVLNAGVQAGTDIQFVASTGRVDLNAPGSFAGTINGFTGGDVMFASGAASISYTGGNAITLFSSSDAQIGTIALSETYASGAFLDNAGTITLTEAPCFLAGTRIATPAGEIAVEALRIGDRVLTASGAARPIKWIGTRAYDGRFIRGNRDVLPIRIRAGALGDNAPRRDLFVSPHHAMFVDSVLIPAEQLVNGRSIVQEMALPVVAYFHIELDSHDILLADGAAAESFLDHDSRMLFHNAGEFAARYPDAARITALCAPRVEGGETLRRIWRRLADRAGIDARLGTLRGRLDAVERRSVSGWVSSEDDAPVWVAVSVDGMPVARGLANRFRPDLAEAGIGRGWHGFRVVLPRALDPARPHRVSVRREADGAELPGSPVLLAVTADTAPPLSLQRVASTGPA